jgi:probable HAF family extracellular repeat protein
MFRRCAMVPGVLCLLLSAGGVVSAGPTYTVTKINMLPGYTPGYDGFANNYDINNSGQVVGYACKNGNGRAFLWFGGSMMDIGTLPGFGRSAASAINSIGQIAGTCFNAASTDRAFLYSDGSMHDLGTLGDPYNYGVCARGINNHGQIVGYGTLGNQGAVFLLTTIPEPSALVLLGMAAISLLAYAWQRR